MGSKNGRGSCATCWTPPAHPPARNAKSIQFGSTLLCDLLDKIFLPSFGPYPPSLIWQVRVSIYIRIRGLRALGGVGGFGTSLFTTLWLLWACGDPRLDCYLLHFGHLGHLGTLNLTAIYYTLAIWGAEELPKLPKEVPKGPKKLPKWSKGVPTESKFVLFHVW